MQSQLVIQGLSPAALAGELGPACTLPEARKILGACLREGGLPAVLPGVRKIALQAVSARARYGVSRVVSHEKSQEDPFQKLLLQGEDAARFETVRIPLEIEGRFTACVSSQVGCALACAFCATGRMGLVRNLHTWEIVEQVRRVRETLEPGSRIRGVVFQGMGEPMANLDRVLESIAILTEPSLYAIDTRAITVTTSGLPSGIRRLAKEAPRVRLGVSLSSLQPRVRRRLMPIEDKHPLAEVLAATREHAVATGLAPLFAYTLLAGVNDDDEHLVALAGAVREFHEATGKRPTLRLIPYNSLEQDDPFLRQSGDEESRVRARLRELGAASKMRYSGGADIAAACGQLASVTAP